MFSARSLLAVGLTCAVSGGMGLAVYQVMIGRQSASESIAMWQLCLLVAVLAVIVGFASWYVNGYVASIAAAIAVTWAFSQDAPNRSTSAEGVWLVAAVVLLAVSAVAFLASTVMVRVIHERARRA